MSIKPGAKRFLIVVLVLYGLFILAFIIKAAAKREDPAKPAIIATLAKTFEQCGKPLSHKQVEAIYGEVFEGEGKIIGFNYTLLMQILNFLILMTLLYGFLWDPMIRFLDERRAQIQGDLDAAVKTREEAEQKLQQYEDQIHEARREHSLLLERAQHEGQAIREQIVEDARREAEQILANARQTIDADVVNAHAKLRNEIGGLAVRIAEKILEREIRAQEHDVLIQGFVKELGKQEISVE